MDEKNILAKIENPKFLAERKQENIFNQILCFCIHNSAVPNITRSQFLQFSILAGIAE